MASRDKGKAPMLERENSDTSPKNYRDALAFLARLKGLLGPTFGEFCQHFYDFVDERTDRQTFCFKALLLLKEHSNLVTEIHHVLGSILDWDQNLRERFCADLFIICAGSAPSERLGSGITATENPSIQSHSNPAIEEFLNILNQPKKQQVVGLEEEPSTSFLSMMNSDIPTVSVPVAVQENVSRGNEHQRREIQEHESYGSIVREFWRLQQQYVQYTQQYTGLQQQMQQYAQQQHSGNATQKPYARPQRFAEQQQPCNVPQNPCARSQGYAQQQQPGNAPQNHYAQPQRYKQQHRQGNVSQKPYARAQQYETKKGSAQKQQQQYAPQQQYLEQQTHTAEESYRQIRYRLQQIYEQQQQVDAHRQQESYRLYRLQQQFAQQQQQLTPQSYVQPWQYAPHQQYVQQHDPQRQQPRQTGQQQSEEHNPDRNTSRRRHDAQRTKRD